MITDLKLMWKHELKKMKLQHIKQTAPGFFEVSGGYEMKILPYNDTTSAGLLKCITDWIKFSGGSINRINNQGQLRIERVALAFGNYRDNIRFNPSKKNKTVEAIINGKKAIIEIQSGEDKANEIQAKEMSRVIDSGSLYFIAKNMQSFVDWYKETIFKLAR